MEGLFGDLFGEDNESSRPENLSCVTNAERSLANNLEVECCTVGQGDSVNQPISKPFSESEEDFIGQEDMDFIMPDDFEDYTEEGIHFQCAVIRGYCLHDVQDSCIISDGFLQRLLHPAVTPKVQASCVVQIFKHRFALSSTTHDAWTRIFMLIRKHIMTLGAISTDVACEALDILNAVEALCDFLAQFVASSKGIADNNMSPVRSGLECIASNMKGLVSGLDPLCTLLEPGGSSTGGALGDARVVLNCYLRAHILGCLYRMVRLAEPDRMVQQLFADFVNFLTIELVQFAGAVYARGSPSAPPPNPHHYECVLELWMVALHVLDAAAAAAAAVAVQSRPRHHGFWGTLKNALVLLLSPDGSNLFEEVGMFADVLDPPSGSLSLRFCWWLVAALAQLHRLDPRGKYRTAVPNQEACSEDWGLVSEFLLPRSLEDPSKDSVVTGSLWQLIRLAAMWSPNRTVLLQLWDHLHKSLDWSPSLSVQAAAGLFKIESPVLASLTAVSTPSHLVSLTKFLTSIDNIDKLAETIPNLPWFCQFLAILSLMFSKSNSCTLWKQIKGRIFSKFHKKRLLELSSTGLTNFILLYLSLSRLAEPGEVGSQLSALLVSLDPIHPACAHMGTIWSGLFAQLLVAVDCGDPVAVSHQAERLSKLVASLSSSCKPSSASGGLLRQGVIAVLQGVLDLFSLPVLSSVHSDVFGPNLGQLVCHFLASSDHGFVLEWSSHLLMQFESHICRLKRSSGAALAEETVRLTKCLSVLFSSVMPGLGAKAEESSPPKSLLTLAVQFYFSSCELFPADSGQQMKVVEEFGLKDSLSVSFAAAFLIRVFTQQSSRTAWLSTERAQLHVLHTWVRCICQTNNPPEASTEVKELTRVVLRLPFVASVVVGGGGIGGSSTDAGDPLGTLRVVLTAMNREATRSPSGVQAGGWGWFQRGEVLFSNLLRIMERGLSGDLPARAMDTCFAAGGVIVSSCPRLIYSRSAPCLLPKLVDALVMPISHPRRPVAPGVYRCIKRHLHSFLQGLLSLEPQRDDFVSRKIKQIFGKYLLSYCQQSQPNPLMTSLPNPFLLLLRPSFEATPTKDAVFCLLFTVELVVTTYFQVPVQLTTAVHVVALLGNVISQTGNCELLARCCLLLMPSLLSCLHASESSPSSSQSKETRKHCISALTKLIRGCDRAEGLVLSSQLQDCVKAYMEEHLGRQHQLLIFKPLEALIPISPSLVDQCLPVAWATVERFEMRCGTGKDRVLRYLRPIDGLPDPRGSLSATRSAYQSAVETVSKYCSQR